MDTAENILKLAEVINKSHFLTNECDTQFYDTHLQDLITEIKPASALDTEFVSHNNSSFQVL